MEENNTNYHQVEGDQKDNSFTITNNNFNNDDVVYMSMDEIKQKSLKEISDKNVVVETNPEEILKEYIKDEDNQKRLDELAIMFNNLTRGKWFTLLDLKKKVLDDMKNHVSLYMDLLVMSKKAFAKKKGEEMIVYKITLNQDQRKKVLENTIQELKKAVERYERELQDLD